MSVEVINGSRTSFGPRDSEVKLPTAVHNAGVKKQLIVPVRHDDLPSHTEGDVTGAALPANAVISAVYTTPSNETFDGDRNFDINLVQDDGSAITTVQSLTVANLNNGAVLTGDTVTDNTVGATGPAYIEVAFSGGTVDPTAGEGAFVVEYIEQIDLF